MGSWAYGHIYTGLRVWYSCGMRSRAFRKLYSMGNCHLQMQKAPEKQLAVYLAVLFPMIHVGDERDVYFELLPGLKDSEWEGLLGDMNKWVYQLPPSGARLSKHLDWINNLDTIRAFSES